NTFIYGASAVRSGGASSDYWNKMPNTLFNTLCIGISMLYPLYLMLLFYCISFNKNKILISGMVLGVICGLVGGLVFATRDRFIYLAIFLIFNIWLWKPYLINSPLYN